jgi:hypothetical protein
MKKMGALFVGLACVVWDNGTTGAAAAAPKFKDVSHRHWARVQIGQAVMKGYVSGFPDGSFDTKKAVTRAEFVKMVVDALRLPHSKGGSPWYQEYVAAAYEFGLLNERDSKAFEKPIKRIEMMRILARALAFEEQYEDYFVAFRALQKSDFPFEDRETFQRRDLPTIALAYGAEIVSGFPDGTMGVNRTASRAETVVMLERWLEVRNADPLIKEKLSMLMQSILQSRPSDSLSSNEIPEEPQGDDAQ